MTDTPKRIRWEDSHDSPGDPAFTGYAGTRPGRAFTIWPPLESGDKWMMSCAFSDMAAERVFRDGPDELKEQAESWLAEFVASLGAVFPEAKCECTISLCECGGLAHHKQGCRWREGYGSRVIAPATGTTATEAGGD